MPKVPNEDSEFLASMALYQFKDGVRALIKIADEQEEWISVPAHMAAQLPMAISMIRASGE